MIMPHVAVLFEFPTLNGGEHSMLAVLKRLSRVDEFRFTALAPQNGPLAEQLAAWQISHQPFEVRDAGGTKRDASELQLELTSAIGVLRPDLLHANSLSMSRLTGQLSGSACPCCRTGHLRDIMRLNAKVIRDLNQNDALVAVSEATREYHLSQGLNPEKCCVIYNGVDLEQFRPQEDTPERSELLSDVPEHARLLLNVGQICLRKGQLVLAQAVREVLRTYPDVHLVLAGARHSEKQESVEYERAIREEFRSHGLSQHLHLAGCREDVADLMNSADILVHAAHQEPFGRTLLEAAACRLPIIATTTGGTAEMLRHGREAILVAPGDHEKLAAAIQLLLADPVRCTTHSANAFTRVSSKFSIAKAATELGEFWKREVRRWRQP